MTTGTDPAVFCTGANVPIQSDTVTVREDVISMKKAIIVLGLIIVIESAIIMLLGWELYFEPKKDKNDDDFKITGVDFLQDNVKVGCDNNWYNFDADKDITIKVEYSGNPNYMTAYITPIGSNTADLRKPLKKVHIDSPSGNTVFSVPASLLNGVYIDFEMSYIDKHTNSEKYSCSTD